MIGCQVRLVGDITYNSSEFVHVLICCFISPLPNLLDNTVHVTRTCHLERFYIKGCRPSRHLSCKFWIFAVLAKVTKILHLWRDL